MDKRTDKISTSGIHVYTAGWPMR